MKFVDDSSKNCKWWNRNYFWCVTLIYIATNIILFALLGRNNLLWQWEEKEWRVFNGLKEMLISFGNAFTHNNWSHVLLNMCAFGISSLYMERKLGSLNYFSIIVLMALFSSVLTSMYVGLSWAGSSVVYFAVWGYVIVDWLFSFRKGIRNRTSTIIGLIVIIANYIWSCFWEESSRVTVHLLPVQLIFNAGHYYGFVVGIILALIINITKLQHSANLNK